MSETLAGRSATTPAARNFDLPLERMIVLENKDRATARQVFAILGGRRINRDSFIWHARALCTPTATVTLPSVSARATGAGCFCIASPATATTMSRRRSGRKAFAYERAMEPVWNQAVF